METLLIAIVADMIVDQFIQQQLILHTMSWVQAYLCMKG